MSLYDISLKASVFLVCALFCGGLYFLALVLFKVPSSKTTRAIRQIGPRNRPTPDGISQLYNNAAQFLSKILPMSKYREQQVIHGNGIGGRGHIVLHFSGTHADDKLHRRGDIGGVLEIMRILKRLRCNRGFSYVMTSVMMIVVLLIGMAVFEIFRVNVEAAAVRDKFEDAIIYASVSNYSNMYADVRESQAATWKFNGLTWLQSNTTNRNQILSYMNRAMSNGEIAQCTIESMNFNVTPAPRAPTDTDTADKFAVEGTMVITIPHDFAWGSTAPMRFTLHVKSKWVAKF